MSRRNSLIGMTRQISTPYASPRNVLGLFDNFCGGSLNVSGVFWHTHCLLFSRSEYQDQNTASSRLVSKSPDQRDSRNQTQKRPGDGTWDLHSGLTELLPVQGALSSFQASFRQPGEKFSALHKASLVSGSELRTAVHWRATVRHGLVAQLVAHSAPNREVAGSTPAWSAFVSEQMTKTFFSLLPPTGCPA